MFTAQSRPGLLIARFLMVDFTIATCLGLWHMLNIGTCATGGSFVSAFDCADTALTWAMVFGIGLTGATDEDAVILSSPGDLKFPKAVETVEKQAAALRKEGADVVVAVVHTDRAKDEEMYRMQAADIILSGQETGTRFALL